MPAADDPEDTAAALDEGLAETARGRGVRLRVGVGAAVVLALLGVAVAVAAGLFGSGGGPALPVAVPEPEASVALTSAPPTTGAAPGAVVQVLGQVAHPGVYELPADARVLDAVAAAGGLTASADPAGLNLARPVTDGEQIVVPRPGEAVAIPPAAGGDSGGTAPSSPVNLNTATVEQLETLPRVGPAMAQRIVDWRTQNGRFASVDELQNVSGIGEKTFAALKDLVTV